MKPGTRVVVTTRGIKLSGRRGTVKGWSDGMVLVQLDGETRRIPFFERELVAIYALAKA